MVWFPPGSGVTTVCILSRSISREKRHILTSTKYNNFEYNVHEKMVTSSKVEILKRLALSWKKGSKIFFYKNQ